MLPSFLQPYHNSWGSPYNKRQISSPGPREHPYINKITPTLLVLMYLICHLHHCFPCLPGGLLATQICLKINKTNCVTNGCTDEGVFSAKQESLKKKKKKNLFLVPLLRCEPCQTAFEPCRRLIPRKSRICLHSNERSFFRRCWYCKIRGFSHPSEHFHCFILIIK